MRERGQPKFSFHFLTLKETIKEVALLSDKQASQASNIPVKAIKENQDLMVYFILHNFNNALSSSEYPPSLNMRLLHQSSKSMTKQIKLIIDPYVFFQT